MIIYKYLQIFTNKRKTRNCNIYEYVRISMNLGNEGYGDFANLYCRFLAVSGVVIGVLSAYLVVSFWEWGAATGLYHCMHLSIPMTLAIKSQ